MFECHSFTLKGKVRSYRDSNLNIRYLLLLFSNFSHEEVPLMTFGQSLIKILFFVFFIFVLLFSGSRIRTTNIRITQILLEEHKVIIYNS